MLPASIFSICCSKSLMPGLTKPCTIRLAISWWWLLAITLRSSSVTLWRSIALGRSIARGWAIVRRRLSVPSVSHSLWSVTVVSWRLLSVAPIHRLLTEATLGLSVPATGRLLPISSLTAIRILTIYRARWPIGIILSISLLAVTCLSSK